MKKYLLLTVCFLIVLTVSGGNIMAASIDKMLAVAYEEVGYLEKDSNSQLDSKNANAGSNNYTKYWRDMEPSLQGSAWCDCFCSWVFKQAYGESTANKLLCGGLYCYYTPESAQCFKNKGQWYTSPKKGDVIYFKNSERICHTGIVVQVSDSTVYTIEGNTSAGSQVIPNGGAVCKKSYDKSNSRIAGYGRPKYDNASSDSSSSNTGNKSTSSLNEIAKSYGYVTASSLNVRTGAGTDFETVSFSPLSKGTKVGICDELMSIDNNKWYYIVYNSKHGFVSANYIDTNNPSQTATKNTAKQTKSASDITVSSLINTAKTVMNKARQEGWEHGTTRSLVPCNDNVISGESLISRTLYDLGFKDQISGGETYKTLDTYLTSHGFKRSKNVSAIRKGSIVLVKHEGKSSISHGFIAVSFSRESWKSSRFDAGTQNRINSTQPIKDLKWNYRKDDVSVYNIPSSSLYKCTANYKDGLLRIFENPSLSSKVLRRIPYGGVMETNGETSGIFTRVKCSDIDGWAKTQFLKISKK